MMKSFRHIILSLALAVSACLGLMSCDKYNYTDQLQQLGSRVEYLEQSVLETNMEVTALHEIILAIEQRGYVTNVVTNADGTYTITFNTGRTVTLRNGRQGRDGRDGTAATLDISVAQDPSDGQWYWYEDSAALTDEAGSRGTNITWDWILGVHFPEWFYDMLPNVGHAHAMFTGEGVSKLEDVGFLLKMSVYIGIVHLFIGHMTGYYNISMQHGGKTAFIHKGGLIMMFFGMIFLCYALTDYMFNDASLTEGIAMYTLVIGIVLLIVGLVINTKAEGAMTAVMAVPELIGQILSYTRLAAIAMSKAGMALAFNYIIFLMIIPKGDVMGQQVLDGVTYNIAGLDWTANIAFLIIAILMFGFLHLVVWTLGILSAGLHALRLQYVELMMRFFDGGGKKFAPLSEKRVKTYFGKQIKLNTKEI